MDISVKNNAKISFISLGCSKNKVNTEEMVYLVREAGYEIVNEDIEADVVVINSCAFIESAKKESIDTILDVAWLKDNRNLKGIVVTGCMSERYREEILDALPEVDAVIGTGSYHQIVSAIEEVLKGEKYTAFGDKNCSPLSGGRVLSAPEYSAYLRISEGCNNCCTYCAIPMIRGRFRSRPMEELVEEAKWLEEQGVKELNIIAQDTSGYGKDLYGKYALAELIKKISEATAIPQIRLLYCYPDKITDELIEELKNNERLVKYIDLPIQHISDRVLKRMNRHGDGQMIRDTVKRLRENVPGIVIRSTAIVGFPGESEEEFEELCNFIKEARFDRFGAFTYSREEGTPAYDFEDQIDEQVKQDRLDILMSIQMEISAELQEERIGDIVPVLVEGYDPVAEACYGRSPEDAPEIDGKVFIIGRKKYKPGSFIKVKITESMDYDLIGEALPGQ
ncbi:MAG: 30S ribosomal protein S12 methylthiotransferase RimO [Clostridia bacterium]|nr:30S ribosomal protein S12 methylthiotransferase RimO [Clostridia bacterium]